MCPYPVFLAREIPELAGDDGLADKLCQFLLSGGMCFSVPAIVRENPPSSALRNRTRMSITRRIIQLADAAELLDDDTVNLTFAVGRADGMCPYPVLSPT